MARDVVLELDAQARAWREHDDEGAGLADGALFQEETERVAQHWLMQDPPVALQWLAGTGLDESTKVRLLSAPGLAISPF